MTRFTAFTWDLANPWPLDSIVQKSRNTILETGTGNVLLALPHFQMRLEITWNCPNLWRLLMLRRLVRILRFLSFRIQSVFISLQSSEMDKLSMIDEIPQQKAKVSGLQYLPYSGFHFLSTGRRHPSFGLSSSHKSFHLNTSLF